MTKRAFSGVQPSGVLHIGNYLGAIKNWVEMQESHDCIFCVVDLHALTMPQDPEVLRKKTVETANIYMAAGIDPERSIVFVQSHVAAHAELTWLLNCVTYPGELERMTQFKEKARKQRQTVSVGLLEYPVLMAADILLYRTDVVPVGEDQKQHIELTRDLALRFNNRFGETFVVPEAMIREAGARIMGLDDPSKKMSKSAESPYNYIALTDDADTVRHKVARAVTDSGREIKYGPEKPALSNLLTIYSLFSGRSISQLELDYRGKGYAEFKRDLAETIVSGLAPFQARYAELAAQPELTRRILAEGAARAIGIARATLTAVKDKMGLLPSV